MVRVEFTIEPFVEGQPGPHVRAAVDAVESFGVAVEFGPFGSTFDVEASIVGDVVGALTSAAYRHDATHVSVHLERLGGS